jgi:magnesium-transporting ATPase (P-type)
MRARSRVQLFVNDTSPPKSTQRLTAQDRADILAAVDSLSEQAFRVLAIAYRVRAAPGRVRSSLT